MHRGDRGEEREKVWHCCLTLSQHHEGGGREGGQSGGTKEQTLPEEWKSGKEEGNTRAREERSRERESISLREMQECFLSVCAPMMTVQSVCY